ncbi:MAG: hypothetical protein AMXMBFR84_24670 [Candidatus Hydrogenedentota bacterium]
MSMTRGFVALSCVFATAYAQPAPQPLPPTQMTTADFQAKVEAADGRVDFVPGNSAGALPYLSCHASTVLQAADGTLMTAYFAGTDEGENDVGIWLSRYDGTKWSDAVRVAKVNETPHWNPVLFREPDAERIYLFFKIGPEIPFWQTYWMHSDDHGATWSDPLELVRNDKGGRGPVRCKPIVLSDGSWLAGASSEYVKWLPFADRSYDKGVNWTRSMDFLTDPQTVRGAIQPTLWESAPGKIYALLRTRGGFIGRTDSEDNGIIWSPVTLTTLPNPSAGVDVAKLADGRLLLMYNPVSKGRTPINLAMSKDNGLTWSDLVSLETEPGEYSYPAIITTDKGIAITYTWKRKLIRCWQVPNSVIE